MLRDQLSHLEASSESFSSCDLTSLFQVVNQITNFAHDSSVSTESTINSSVRVILIYGRSHVIPTVDRTAYDGLVNKLLSHPNFFMDILYLHERPDNSTHDFGPQEVYDLLTSLEDTSGENGKHFYMFESVGNAPRVYTYSGLLLAHPLQRHFDQVTAKEQTAKLFACIK